MGLKPLFRGKLVRLAAGQENDYEAFARWTENDEYMRLMDTAATRPMSKAEVEDFEKNNRNPNEYSFRIRTLAEDKLIGYTGLEVNWSNQHAFLAIGIGEPEYWGKGYGGDALQLILRYGFDELGLYVISLNVISYNTRAIRAYEKVGFVHEGTQREVVYRDGKRWDMVYYGLLRREWEQLRREAP